MRKFIVISLLTLMSLQAQEIRILNSNGNLSQKKKNTVDQIATLEDTLSWQVPPSVDFGFFGQDWIVQWFEMPGDLIVKAAGFNCTSVENPETELELKLVKLNWTKEQILNVGRQNLGYYPSSEDGITSFIDNPDATGDWISVNGDTISGSPFGNDFWSDGGLGLYITPQADGECQWIDMNILGKEYPAKKGDIIGIAIKNTSGKLDSDRVGFMADAGQQIPSFKFYKNGRSESKTDIGWWSREYTFDFRLAVELTGDIPPIITNETIILTSASNAARKVNAQVIDYNPSGGAAGVQSVSVFYSLDRNTWLEAEMTNTEGDLYEGEIPELDHCGEVYYYYKAIDVNGNSSRVPYNNYMFYIPCINNKSLLIFNGMGTETTNTYPQSFYFNTDDYPLSIVDSLPYDFRNGNFDIWAYGPVSSDLLNVYSNVIEICGHGNIDDNRDAILDWINNPDGADSRHYMIAGDEWVKAYSDWTQPLIVPGTYKYDVLGYNYEYIDISRNNEQESSIVYPVEDTQLGNEFFNLYTDSGDSMFYDPLQKINRDNLLDGFGFNSGVEVFMKGIGSDGNEYDIGGYHCLSNGAKVAVLGFDPLSITSKGDDFWFSYTWEAPHIRFARSFFYENDLLNCTIADIGDTGSLNYEFSLSANYPNPFNPSTTIEYSIPTLETMNSEAAFVSLNVYNIIGEKVATLVSELQKPGKHKINFNGTGLASGIYFYKLELANFVSVKKMVLLK